MGHGSAVHGQSPFVSSVKTPSGYPTHLNPLRDTESLGVDRVRSTTRDRVFPDPDRVSTVSRLPS